MSRKEECAPVVSDDVASACVNSSYYLVPTSWFLLPGSYFLVPASSLLRNRCTNPEFLLPGSYFQFITKKMSYQSSLQNNDCQVPREDRKKKCDREAF